MATSRIRIASQDPAGAALAAASSSSLYMIRGEDGDIQQIKKTYGADNRKLILEQTRDILKHMYHLSQRLSSHTRPQFSYFVYYTIFPPGLAT